MYRIDPGGAVVRVLSQPAIDRPNGLAMTPDDSTLYVIDSHPRPGGNRKIWAFDVAEDGSASGQRLVFDFGKGRGGDGMRLDTRGNLWVAAGIAVPRTSGEDADVPPGIYVITPGGKLLGRIPIPEDVITNLAFGGPDARRCTSPRASRSSRSRWRFPATRGSRLVSLMTVTWHHSTNCSRRAWSRVISSECAGRRNCQWRRPRRCRSSCQTASGYPGRCGSGHFLGLPG